MIDLEDALKGLTPRQRDLLLRRLGKAPDARPEAAPDGIARLPRGPEGEGTFPPSFAQQRLWFLDRLEPGSASYNLPVVIAASGPLDAAALEASLRAIVHRHEALRTTFETRAEGPVQAVHSRMEVPLPAVDLRALPAGARETEALRLAREEAERPFDLARGPLLRAALVRLGQEDWRILLTLHHIVSDGWSMGVLVEEIAALYPALRAGESPRLPELPIQYADYAVWQRQRLQGELLESQLAFWRRRLAGAPVLQLPTDHPRPPVQRFHGRHQHRRLDAGRIAPFRALCRREGATLFMGMLAAFQALLARHAGVDDLVVGTPVAGRERRETEGLIGFFLNSLALRGDLTADPPFRELLDRTRRATLEAFAHQEVPFERLVDELLPERNLGHAPLFQVMLVQQNAPAEPLRLAGATLVPGDVEGSTSKFDLTLNFQETPGGLTLRWLSNRDLFDAPTIDRLSEHLVRLLEGAAAEPGRRLSELPLLTAAEERQLVEWNDTAAAIYPAGAAEPCLPELIAAQVERAPEAVAVSCEGEALSYRELWAAAGRLAARLRALGVGPEVVVGVCAERSLELMVGLLAVLRAGGAYLPLDPDYPAERLAFMLADSGAPVVLAQERLLERLPAHGAEVVLLDGVAAPGEPAAVAPGTVASNLAYVIYTSGSTGRPKGTMNTHRGIVNRLLWMQERYGLTAEDRVLQKTPFSFDVSVWELFWPLLSGARLVMARPGGHQDPAYLARTIAQEGITTLHFVPSMLQVFLETPGLEACGSLRRVVCSGEALPLELTRRFFARFPEGAEVELHNLYGPTEAAVDVTSWACEREGSRGVVPIGHPVANTRILLLGLAGERVPVGVAGELCIGGVQVCRGYLARPELTAEKFVPDPFAAEPGSRLYRTGDLARYLPDGAIDFLGRIDTQVKVRGLRIELGEIESALTRHPAVREAVVVARAAGSAVGAVNLVAYVTLFAAAAAPSLEELRQGLSKSLPDYMLPSALVVLESLPLTASGKVDRKALPAPERLAEGPRERVAPRTPLERALAGLWSEVLGIAAESIGVADNFFQLGGSSITGAIFINRLQETLREIVHVVTIFDAPTVAGLAALLRKEYPRAVARLFGGEPVGEVAGEASGRRIDAASLVEVRRWIRVLGPLPEPIAAEPKNPSAVFVLSPPRSGSTLLRVMLGGHPGLFAPPELELLNFDTLRERREAFPGRDAFRLEGLARAVMEARGCAAEEALEEVARLEGEGASTRRMYRLLQDWIGGRTLVDKTPTYAWDPEALRRAEAGFEAPRYIHLLRHPLGMVRSFEEARIDQIFFHGEHPFSRRELAELLWEVAYENTLAFLAGIPRERRHAVRFEELLREPEAELRRLCAFLGLEYHPAMAEPYRMTGRMTDGLHAESRMLGDVKFHQHSGVDAAVAERWREDYREESLGEPTRELAARLGYEIAAPERAWSRIPRTAWAAGEPLPLSFAQERLWFLSRLDPDSPAYNISAALRLLGRLDAAALAATFAEIARRHAVLRTTFTDDGHAPVQVVYPWQATGLAVVDLAGLPAAGREAAARELALEDLRRPFDLERGPLLRTTLVRLGDEEHLLLSSMHHIVSDGWSLTVLVREVGALYRAFALGEPSPLPELPVQYADYAVWQRDRLRGEALSAQVAYWRERLAGAPALLRLPLDRPRPAVQRFRGARVDAWLPPELGSALREAGQRQGATLFMVLLAVFAVLLRRHTGEDDLVVGTPSANRDRAELEGLIGFFVNTLVLRADLSGDPSFAELLQRARETALGAYAHQDLPFEKLVAELQPERSLSYSPLFQIMLALQNASPVALELPGLILRDEQTPQEISKLDLTLTVNETPAGLLCQWRYNSELFDRGTVERLADRLRILAVGIAADPGRPVSELPMVAAAERRQLLAEWSRGETVETGSRGLHGMVEEAAARRPEAPALLFDGGELSYGELNARANRLARRLRRLGVGPEALVGVCAERSPEMVVGLIAVLKAGGAYVPLDPAYPRERLAWLLDDSGIRVLLTREHLREVLPPHAAQVVLLDEEPAESAGDLRPLSGPENLAYVIYTSGSTGRPKGVLVSHRGLDNLARAQTRLFEVGPHSRVLQFASMSFDASVSEIAMAFHAGAALCLAARRDLLPGPELVELLQRHRITTVTLPPSALAALPEAELPDLRTLVLAGEAGPVELARRWSAGRRLINAYGPTEATVCATEALYTGGDRMPIGRPIQNMEAYVLDDGGQPVPSGVPGELLVGGIGLARGYRGRPGLTAERFVPHPFSTTPGERLYRTGDLARFLPDANLEFLGRIDHQIKVRGVRVEPGEVEAALLAQAGVREAVAVAREDGSGPARLVAYVTPAAGADLDPASLRSALAASLPEPLVPAAVVVLDALPLTPNGKVDRRALPAPDRARTGQDYVPPATGLERFLAGLWQEILGIDRAGLHDDFFALGGNSVSGAMFVNRLQRELGEIVHVVVMFDAPTVAQLTSWVVANYPEAVVRLFGPEALGNARRDTSTSRVDAARVAGFRALIPPPLPLSGPLEKNPPAAFVLSPPRSGSTLLRVMLAGNPGLFAPPELELLPFDTLAERRAAFPGRNSFWLEGATRAVMEVRGCGAEEAEVLLEEMESAGGTTRELYRRLQGRIGERLLVDKTPSYALDLEVLRRAEQVFAGARYIHLLRHPYGMIRSFEEAKLEQVFFRHPHSLPRRELAELIWLVSQQNILRFLAEVPPERRMQVRFEDLVAAPEAVLRDICDFLGVEYHPDMAEPYKEKSARMTDGIHAWSRMLGDVKFHQHAGVDRAAAERWRELAAEDFLGDLTWEMAEGLGYPRERPQALAPIVPASAGPGSSGPLSFAQERLWVLDRMDPGSPAYNILSAVRLTGRLDVPAMARSLTEIVRRHAVLRSVLTEIDRRPAQVVEAPRPVPLPLVDLGGLPAAGRESEARRLAAEAGRRPYDLARGPMLRSVLLRLGEEEHAALFGMHHIASDGWSMGVLIREVSALYAAFREGRPSPLPELPIQYLDYARWQRDWLKGEMLAAELAYWREQLRDAPPVSQLPLDRPRPAVQRFHGRSVRHELPEERLAALRHLFRQEGATLFMGLLAAFFGLLARQSGTGDLVVGTPVAGRSRVELESLIGLFLNTLLLRLRLPAGGDPGFRDLLAQVRGLTLGAFARQDLPFAKLVEELSPERTLSHTPLFQVQMVLEEADSRELRLPGLTLAPGGLDVMSTSKLDLTLRAHVRRGGLELVWLYNTDLFDEATIRRLGAHFEVLLAGAAAEPGRRLSELPLLTAAEERQLVEWNDTAAAYPSAPCLHELIAAQVERAPEAVAVSCEGESLTYRELWVAAGRLAARLRALGVGPEVVVGVCAERSLELMVGLLAVLRAGGAYLPLDPNYPAERLAFMLADSGAPVVLAQERLLERLPAHGAEVVLLDGVAAPGEPAAVAPGTGASNLAYVIYTSGSTGRPKGTMNTHRGIVNRLLWMQERYGLTAEDRVLQKTPFSFDVSVWELFWPLLSGARLVMARPGGHQDPAYLARTIAQEGITTLHFVPSMLQVFLETPGLEACGSLRRVVCSGEALPLELTRRFFARFPEGAEVELHNLYGPTEAAVDVTFWACERESRRGVVPIGHPVANTRIHLLGPAGERVPVGVAGELCIGGVQVCRGYLARPELTAEKFVPDPFAAEPGSRLYRTGDLARYLPDGAIDFLGRIDHQVKVRGLRIELGEIESALAAHPAVREAVVVARAAGSAVGAVNLVAYVTLFAAAAAPSLEELRQGLSKSLPDYMLPSALVVLESLPLTASGKVDRKALPAPERLVEGPRERVAPRTPLERSLAGLWSEVLGIAGEPIGVEDSFFQIGGNSITGAIFINRLQQELGEIVHVVTIFDAPTIAELAAYLTREYPGSVARLGGGQEGRQGPAAVRRIGDEEIAAVDRLIRKLPDREAAEPGNPSAVFVLSPPRSGSTLLRVMLGGNPRLFAPPELELLGFNTLAERREAFAGRDAFRLEGALRAVMEARGVTAEEATELVAGYEREGMSTQGLYRLLQEWIGDRTLVDKTPTYSWDEATLRRAEEAFSGPRYIHLVRHPYGVIRSFEEARIDQIFFHQEHPFSRRDLAEALWVLAHRNIERFLAGVPSERQYTVRFEDLLGDPEGELRALCSFLGVDYHPDMAEPYKAKSARMTDGLHAESRMLGDVKFHQHQGVDTSVAERWREEYKEDFLGEPARELAGRLGYEVQPARTWVPIERRPIEPGRPLPLSFAQERLWFLEQLDPGKPTYNIPNVVRLAGVLDAGLLARALREVVRRHAVLRTVFSLADGQPAQTVSPREGFGFTLLDLAALREEAREVELRRRIAAEVSRPFDLGSGPLLRVLLLRLAPEEHVAVLTMHHIVSDGWSMGVLIRELGDLYAAFSLGRPSPLPELPVQYADFARWQREQLRGEVLEAEIAYWRERLAGAQPLELPTDRPRPPLQTTRGAAHPLFLPRELRDGLVAFGRREGATLFMTGLAAFAALLARLSGQDDIALGTPSANRNRAEIEGLIGFFVNTLVVRTDAGGDPSFRTLLARARQASVGAFAHQDLPFEKVVEELHPDRALSRSPLFQVMFVLQNTPRQVLELPGLRLLPEAFSVPTSKFDLTLVLAEHPDGALAGLLEYNTDLFDAATAARWAGHLELLLRGIVEGPERRVSELPLLTAEERWQLLSGWNDTAVEWPRETLLHELFERQAAATPEAWAVGFGGQRLSYGELAARSNRLARHLRRLGVGPEVLVGLCVERSAEMVVALLAILKAGGAYVPLDPSHPAERLALVLEDSGAPVLLTMEPLLAGLPAHGATAVCLDRDAGAIARESAAPLARSAEPESLAYVLYTSGSTGRPKGVGLPHRAVVNFLRAMAERPGLSATDVVPALTTLSFDIAGLEIYLPLAVGGRVEVLDREEAADGARLARRLAEVGATVVQATPATWRLLIDSGWEGLPGLKALCGGEALPRDLAAALLARGVELWNVYGPTETAVWSSAGQVAAGEGPVRLGPPIANTVFYVVDPWQEPVPVGVAGELWIGGAGLARGYWRRPDLTAERFVPRPFGPDPGARAYRTGDLVRYRETGELEFLGRIDHQVKVRGFRIELGEIEAALLRHPAMRQAVVVVREEGGDKRLVGYLVAEGASAAAELRDFLRRALPDYMIPSAFVALESLPLTPSGKVDRKALPAPEAGRAEAAHLEPEGPVEELVAGIWAEVLHRERVGAEESFFDLGGHSLLATQVVSRLRVALGIELPLRSLFEAPTVRAFSRAVERARQEGGAPPLPPITPASRDGGALPLSYAQERMWFLHQLDPELTAYNINQVIRLRGEVDVRALENAFAAIVRRHESLRTVFAAEDGEPRQIVLAPAPVSLIRVDLRGIAADRRERETGRCTRALSNQPFALATGPLFQAALIEIAEDDCALLVLMHHIISDAWSMRRMTAELAALYAAEREGRPSPLPELPIQYADFASWQRRWMTGEALAPQLGYWTRQLAGAPPLLELPTDRPRPAVHSSRGARHRFEIPGEVLRRIKEIGRRWDLTPFMVLLAAFESLLWRYTDAPDLVVGVPIANRNRAEIEGLIGTFVNMLALRTRLSGGTATFLELCGQLREIALDAFAHQDLPFERLVDELQPERSLSHSPVFQVMFNLQNQPAERLDLPGLSFIPMPAKRTQAQVDLTLAVGETYAGDRMTGFFELNADLFDAATISRMAAHFTRLLASATADPEQALSGLPLLGEGERWQLLAEWSDTAEEREPELLIHELFTRRAAAMPAAAAVSAGPLVLSYGELDARSSRLAHHLRSLGVGPEARVGICLERTPEMVVALLAVLKAGGAYVPLDPGHPAERIGMVLADAEVAVLVTEERWLGGLPPHGARTVCLDRDRQAIAAAAAVADAAAPPPRTAAGDNLAYVIYTSGSTGKPKGVQLPHRAVVNFLLAMMERPGLTAQDAVPAITTLTFDIAGLEIYLPLAVGGRVEVLGREEATDGERLAARLAAMGATVLQATPATWRLLIDSGWQGLPGLKGLCGGEALPRELADALLDRGVELWNVYGPTETAVWSAAGPVAPSGGAVRLGRPIANTELYVVDRQLGPAPVGVGGELLIGGAGLARGYWGRPDLTAERFIPHPFAAAAGARVYRTGDLVRYRPAGELEFLGRIDHQVKVRGFRIELGEIEAALSRHPAVRQVVVTVREDGGDKRLVAYLVAVPPPAAGELREHLRQSLPEYMIPAAFVVLDTLPLTPSGKVDRKALPAPETGLAEEAYVPPQGPVEELLAGIWAEVLRLPRVGARESFFSLGGHSLLATQVVSRVRAALGVELPLQRLFETPTVAGLARAVEAARREQEGLSLPPILRVPRGQTFPLSFSQERMWFLNQLDPGSSAYNLSRALRLRGRLDLTVLGRCFSELIRRHETLRTSFALDDGRPVQVVRPPVPVAPDVVDLRHLPPAGREAEARAWATAEAARPFDLSRDLLIRATLLRLAGGEEGETESVLLLTVHHICADGWSLGILIRELAALYRALAAGERPALPELPIQYVDFSTWQRTVLSGETLEAEKAWWSARLAGTPPPLLLPADRRRSAVHGFQPAVGSLVLPAGLAEGLRTLSRRQSASLYMTLLAGWKALLARLTGEEDLLLGAPIANRTRAEIEGLIGFFLNTLVLRTDLSGDPAFQEALSRVRETCLGAFSHQDLPLEQVLEAMHAGHGSSPFQVMFLLQNVPTQEIEIPGLTFSPLAAEQRAEELGTAIFEVGLTLMEQPDGILAALTYNALLFDEPTIQALLARYERLLAGAVADPARPFWDYPLLSAEEERELLAWNGAAAAPLPVAPAAPEAVHRLFERRAAEAPDALALIAGDRRLTYTGLNREANRLARHLRALGVGPEVVVGIAAERSPEMVTALLAVLKAGGAYVPLDPAYPMERLAYILEDAGAAVLVSTGRVLAALPGLVRGGLPVVDLDADAGRIAEQDGADLGLAVDSESLAYLIYTSGSTGRPKGVMIRHAALANYVEAFRDEHALGAADRVLQFASISFDTSAEEIYPCLASGAALALRDDAMLGSTAAFLRACREWGISVLDLPTAFWHELVARLEAEPAGLPETLRLIVIGGERALPERLAAWQAQGHRGVRLLNTYGPTECTIVATRAELRRAEAGEVPIGRPVRNLRAWVLDPRLRLAAPGVPGELCIGGAGLARGYAGRPDLTAERFAPDPWSPEPGGRMYRTGDLVRLLPSGDLEFLGRTDDQVKIRGFRVELREIEAVLAEAPGVAEAVVVAREDTPGDRRLAAYLVAGGPEGDLEIAALRNHLKGRLPDYMIPASFTLLDRFPLTPSGKVDRRSLPAPDRARRGPERDFVAPRTDSEERIAAIWAEVLGLDRVGVTENFFELGGHSLLLPQVIHRLRAAFQVEVPLRVLFEEPTIEGLAVTVEEILLAEIERQLGEEEAVVE